MVRIGFIGLGAMGSRMTIQLLEHGYEMVVYDPRPEAVESLVERGAVGTEDATDVARQADVVMLSLPGPDEVQMVVDEVEDGFDEGDVLIDLTTSKPTTTNAVADQLAEHGVHVLGAPVSGGPSGAEEGTLAVMVGGDHDVFERCEEIFDVIGGNVVYIDEEPGHGHAMKLTNNYLSFVAMICTSEAIVLGKQVGLEPETMLDVFNSGSARNTATSFKFPEYILPETYDMEYSMALVEKDMQLLMDVSNETKTPFMAGGTIRQLIGYVRGELGSDADYTEIYKYFDQVMGEAKD
ncbi:NAD(P)-dependent oxidoreductase [Haloferax sp. YSMS24]